MKYSKMHGHYAYLIAYLDITKLPVVVKHIGIYSEDARSLTHNLNKEYTVTVYEGSGSSYGEACNNILTAIENNFLLAWVKPYIDIENKAVYDKIMKHIKNMPQPFALIFGDEE